MAAVNQGKAPRRRSLAEINTVPYIDVMLVLLVIFMVTAPLLSQGVKVELPQASAKPLPPEADKPVIVTVDPQGAMYLNQAANPESPLSDEELQRQVMVLLAATPNAPVLVRADETVAYGKVVQAMVLLQQSNATSIGLMTEPKDKQ